MKNLLSFSTRIPWWFLAACVFGFGFFFFQVGPVAEEPEGNLVLGLFLFLGLALSLAKIFGSQNKNK